MTQYQFKLDCLANSAVNFYHFFCGKTLLTTSMEKVNDRDKNHVTERQRSRLWPQFVLF